MSRHTPGPWLADFGATRIEIFGSDESAVVAQIYKSTLSAELAQKAEANARRIVACVNACEGMANPEAGINALRAQRDELLAALALLLLETEDDPRVLEITKRNARTAIAKATGAQS